MKDITQIEQTEFINDLSSLLNNWNEQDQTTKKQLLQIISERLELKQYPLFENKTTVILIYKGNANNVSFIGDTTGWADPIKFRKLFGTDFYYLILNLESDARIQYQLIIDGIVSCDPSNRYKSLHGLGEMSELAMPEYVRHPLLEEFSYGKQGSFESLIKHSLPAGALPYEHEIHVLLPNYYMVGEKYPTVYFHDGPDYIRFGLVPHLMNELVEAKKIKPFLAVFVTPPNLHQSSTPNRSTEYGLNDNYVKFFCDELMTFVDKNYRTINLPESRLVVGDSYAGLISFYIAFSRPDSFANAYSQSGYFSFNNDQIIKLFRSVDRKKIKLYFDVGTYETKVGADFLPATELDFTNANRRMQDVLIMKNYNFCYNEYHEGHTWGNWRRHLIDAFQFFLGKE